jgi:dihydrofolate reductase
MDSLRLTVHMVSSVDGFIAKPDETVSWIETPDTYDKGVDGDEPEEKIDCFVMGSRTYEHAMELSREFGWPYGDVPTFVLTSRNLRDDRPNVVFYSGNLNKFVNEKLKPNYKNIWVVGGAALTKDLIRLKLVDDIRQTIVPIILGNGTPFFDRIGLEQPLHLKDATAYKNGMVALWYEVKPSA